MVDLVLLVGGDGGFIPLSLILSMDGVNPIAHVTRVCESEREPKVRLKKECMCVVLLFFWSPDLMSSCIQFKYINTHTHMHTHHLVVQECMPAHLKVNV